jgi:hypothetical protein
MLKEVEAAAEVISLSDDSAKLELKKLQETWNHIRELKEKYDSGAVARDIRALQESSRIQGLRPGRREQFLEELARFKFIKKIVDGDTSV